MFSALGYEEGYTVRTASFVALGIERTDFEVACHDFAPESHVDGLLGADFLEHDTLVIQYAAGIAELL